MRGITAAGRRVDLTSEREVKSIDSRPLAWQKRAYNFYDPMSDSAVGEVWFSGRYVSESMARVRLVPAMQLSPDSDPIPLTQQSLDGMPPEVRPDDDTVELLHAAVARLTNSHGGQADIMRNSSLNNFIAGESFLVGTSGEHGEEWNVHSVEAIIVIEAGTADRPARMGLKTLPDDTGDKLLPLDDSTLIRIWRRHPRYPELPDAALGAALTYCEDLWALTQMIRAAARSRMPSGILLYPSTLAPVDQDDDDPETDQRDPFMEQLIRHFETPLMNPEDASALVPFLWRMDPEEIALVKHLDFSRPIDTLAVELRRESREAFAATIDLPADVLTGKQGLNDWSAWNVDEETFRVHLAPHAELICDSLTAGYLIPTIETGVEDPRRFRIWYDASNLVVHPNQAENAKAVHAVMAISDATLRDTTGFDESDKPDEEEVARRIAQAQAIAGTGAPAEAPAEPGGAENGAPTPAGPDDAAPDAIGASGNGNGPTMTITYGLDAVTAVTAAASKRDVRETLGFKLAQIEQRLIERLLTAADAELRRALERAGNRLASAARKRTAGAQINQITRAHPTCELAAALGPSLVASLSLTNNDLLDTAFDALEARWETWVRRAQEESLRLIQQHGTALAPEVEQRLLDRMTEDRQAGWLVLRDSLVQAAVARLYAHEEPTGLGERDSSILVDAGALRRALQVAGGWPMGPITAAGVLEALEEAATTGETQQIRTAATEPPVQGLMSGDSTREALAEAGIATQGYVWVYGDEGARGTPFEPHRDLDGEEFTGFDSEVLANNESWPDGDFYAPDDHPGCQCTYAILEVGEGDAAPADEEFTSNETDQRTFDLMVERGMPGHEWQQLSNAAKDAIQSSEERAAIQRYMGNSRPLNDRLRFPERFPDRFTPTDALDQQYLANMDLVTTRATLGQDMEVFRGVHSSLADLQPGSVFTDAGFQSTTTSPMQAVGFGNNVLVIDIKATQTGMFGSTLENEFVLPRGLTMQVTSRTTTADGVVFHVRII